MVAALEAFDRAFLLAARLAETMSTALAERGLTTARAEVIFVLRQRGPLVQRELAQLLRCSPRQVTALVDALTDTGFVRRGPHPTDRRAALVALTDQGRTAARRILRERAKAAEELLGDAPKEQLVGFVATVDRLVAGLDRRHERA
ncbi:MAG: MarR family transcriptional regulator [Pseudonocardiaceae bacterium]|nr:MarR family transcriptional regulator [Pseudonocardiaceae bacterium]